MKRLLLGAFACLSIAAQAPDPAVDPLTQAYESQRTGDLVGAIAYFRDAQALAPEHASIPKDLGYLYLKTAQPEKARDAFLRALELDADDWAVRLELAYLRASLGEQDQALKLFEEVAQHGDPDQIQAAKKALAAADSGADPAYAPLDRAYRALREKDYDRAVAEFAEAISAAPDRARLHKELAYALMRTGETEAARDAFAEALSLDPHDEAASLELAFLRHDTGRHAEALAGFRRLSRASDPAVRKTASEAAERLEAGLAADIARWEQVVAQSPEARSARLELARLYQRRGDAALAAPHFQAAYALPGANPDEILLALVEAREASGDAEGATGARLLAARSQEIRIAETAKDSLPDRYPYANEFRSALALKPDHTGLRKDLGYLLLEVGETDAALAEFERVVQTDPKDLQAAAQLAFLYLELDRPADATALLEDARRSDDPEISAGAGEVLLRVRERQAQPSVELGEKSLQRSYLKDAQRLFSEAWQLNPDDYAVALKLGVVHNLLQQDREAVRWFKLASMSSDPTVSEQALRSYRALAPSQKRVLTTVWAFPFFSQRFGTVFGYGQAKTEFRLDDLPVRPYLSLRIAGDVRRRSGGAAAPQVLSESSLIAAFGLRAPLRGGVTLWGEAGQAVSYLAERPQFVPRAGPDYRGGLNWFRAKGPTLGSDETGFFQEFNVDAVYISRFDDDVLVYGQYRPGVRLPTWRGLRMQSYFNWNLTADTNRDYWGNYVEAGPGLRIRIPKINPPMNFSLDWVRGIHLSNRDNPRRPNYFDVRAGVWYSFSK